MSHWFYQLLISGIVLQQGYTMSGRRCIKRSLSLVVLLFAFSWVTPTGIAYRNEPDFYTFWKRKFFLEQKQVFMCTVGYDNNALFVYWCIKTAVCPCLNLCTLILYQNRAFSDFYNDILPMR